MPKPKVAFVVGHSHWGKSHTLRELTDGNTHQRRIRILNDDFFIRRMSNDDWSEGYIERMTAFDPSVWPYIIAALCPDFEEKSKGTELVLNSLRNKGYKLFFWVMKKKFNDPDLEISENEINRLRKFGHVVVVPEVLEATVRAKKFRTFIEVDVLG